MTQAPAKYRKIADDFKAIRDHLNTMFYERDDLIDCLIQGVVTQHHVYALGAPGTGKTAIIMALIQALGMSKSFLTTMHPQMSADELLGAYNVKLITDEGRMVRNTTGMLPEADYASLDEFGKSSPPTVQPTLSAMNERVYMEEGVARPIPLKAIFAGSNEELTEIEMSAARDRFLYRVIVNFIESAANFDRLMQQVDESVHNPTPPPPVIIDKADVEEFHQFVKTVSIPKDVREATAQIRKQLSMNHQIDHSDRRWKWTLRAAQGRAALNGRSVCEVEDLEITKHTLWEFAAQRSTVEEVVTEIAVPNVKQFLEWQRDLRTWRQRMDKIIDDAGPNGDGVPGVEKHGAGIEINKSLGRRITEINDEIESARREGRSTTKFDAFVKQLAEFRGEVYSQLLGIDAAGVGLDMTKL